MTTIEAALAVPMVLLLVFALLLAAPVLYADAVRSARAAVAVTRSDEPVRPDAVLLVILASTDSVSMLSGTVPGLGDALLSLGGVREDAAVQEGPTP